MTRNNRQISPIERSPLELLLEIIAALGVLAGIIIIAKYWQALPDIIPIHFGITGKPDNWGHKSIILIFPFLALIMDVGYLILNNYPHTFNYPVKITPENAAKQYKLARNLLLWVKIEMIWMFAFIDWQIVQVSLGNMQKLAAELLFIILAVIFGTTGFYLWKVYRFQ